MPVDEFRGLRSNDQRSLLESIWSYLVKLRAGFKCEISGETESTLNSHHLIGKDTLRLRTELSNGICITAGIHKFDAHGTRIRQKRFEDRVKQLRGSDVYDKLYAIRNGKTLNKVGLFIYFKEKYQEYK
jgi:hypothetical protein